MAKKTKDEQETKAEASDGSMAVNDAWTGMLAVSLLALMIGAGFLYYDFSLYSDNPPAPTKVTQTPPGAVQPPAPGKGVPPPPPKVDANKDKDAGKEMEKKDAAPDKKGA